MDRFMDIVFASPVWGMSITIGAYMIGVAIQKKTKIMALQPILVASVIIVAFLTVTGRSYAE